MQSERLLAATNDANAANADLLLRFPVRIQILSIAADFTVMRVPENGFVR